VVDQQLEVKILAVDDDALLSGDEAETCPKLKNELLHLAQNCRSKVRFAVGIFHIAFVSFSQSSDSRRSKRAESPTDSALLSAPAGLPKRLTEQNAIGSVFAIELFRTALRCPTRDSVA
jgi:hypothetical protein